jgi:hypothetical protein
MPDIFKASIVKAIFKVHGWAALMYIWTFLFVSKKWRYKANFIALYK